LKFEALEDRRLLAVLTVDSLLDNFNPAAPTSDGVVTLREAILAANTDAAVGDAPAGSGMDEISFAVSGTIHLASQLPTITADLSIDGGGKSIAIAGAGGTGGGGYRIFEFNDGNAGNQIVVSLKGLTLTGGNTSGNGGAILNSENLTVAGTTIWSNYAGIGGGISNTGTVHLENVTIADNETLFGGGGIFNSGPADLESVTIVGNNGGFGNGGGISTGINLSLNNSVLAMNTASNGSANDISGSVASGSSFNFFERGSPSISTGGLMNGVNGNIVGNGAGGFLSARLSALDYYGGAIPTFVPLAGSPLLDSGDDTVGAISDARGVPYLRNDGNGVDIGAVERQTLPGLTLVVNATNDVYDGDFSAGNLSLREAIGLANGSVGADVITFGALFDSPQTIAVGSQLRVFDDVTMDGAGKLVTLDAGGGATASPGDGYRIFQVDDGVAALVLEVTLRGLTMIGGDPASNSSFGQGGAILNAENLTLEEVTLAGNTAATGGAVFNTGELTLIGSTLNDNSASGQGGGIWATNQVTVENSTISANSAGGQGGGINLSSGILNIVSSTLTLNNSATQGGGIVNSSGTATVNSSIVAGNTASSGADVSGVLTTSTFNLIGGDPLLGPLADNGGPTPTHALLLTSPALNAGDPAITTGTDQRGSGFERVELGRADSGAFEYQEANLPVDLIVSSTADTIDDDFTAGQLTLREAIRIANLRPGADTIEFDPTLFSTPQTIATGSLIDISDALTITGPGQDLLTIDGGLGGDGLMNGNGHTLLRITSPVGGAYDVEISGLVLTGGDGTGFGGAIFSSANLLLSDVTVQNNAGSAVGGVTMLSGTAITVEDSLFAGNLARSGSIDNLNTGAIQGRNITIVRSTFDDNRSSFGAGAVNAIGSTSVLNITDSTFHDNSASLSASAVRIASASANIVNSTFSANENGLGVIVQSGGGTMNISHSTFADSTLDDLKIDSGTANVTHSILKSVVGTLATNTFNLIGGNAMLAPLADNGGPTLTHALLSDSPAINAGDPTIPFDPDQFDQRGPGFPRVLGGQIDIGAFEVQPAVQPPELPGDYNLDSIVDAADYTVWRNTLGTSDIEPYSGADGDGNGSVEAADYGVWKSNYGQSLSTGAGSDAAAIAEPPASPPTALSAGAVDAVFAVHHSPTMQSADSRVAHVAETLQEPVADQGLLLLLRRRANRGDSPEPADAIAVSDKATSQTVPETLETSVAAVFDELP
jgi:hypothetical protein